MTRLKRRATIPIVLVTGLLLAAPAAAGGSKAGPEGSVVETARSTPDKAQTPHRDPNVIRHPVRRPGARPVHVAALPKPPEPEAAEPEPVQPAPAVASALTEETDETPIPADVILHRELALQIEQAQRADRNRFGGEGLTFGIDVAYFVIEEGGITTNEHEAGWLVSDWCFIYQGQF